jgi:ADP-dependent NAD(P)H-hydrate dehydratase / NAD(P)H-hydrate epimerase
LNIIAMNKWQKDIPQNAIITPHPKEFTRLFGEVKSHYEMVELQKKKSIELGIYIILKTAHTTITDPTGSICFNNTGNPGMAKAGSGDVLTGMLLGYCCWLKNPIKACIAAVYHHGKAGNYAKESKGEISMTASDITEKLFEVHLQYELERE